MKQLLLLCNLTSFLVLLMTSVVFFIAPVLLVRAGLGLDSGRMLLMQLISFLLLMGSFQKNLSTAWRRFSLAASFIVLSQALLVSLLASKG